MLNIIAMEILINDLLSNKSVFYNRENNYVNHFFAFIFVCVLNLIQITIKLKEKEDGPYLEWRRWGEKRNLTKALRDLYLAIKF